MGRTSRGFLSRSPSVASCFLLAAIGRSAAPSSPPTSPSFLTPSLFPLAGASTGNSHTPGAPPSSRSTSRAFNSLVAHPSPAFASTLASISRPTHSVSNRCGIGAWPRHGLRWARHGASISLHSKRTKTPENLQVVSMETNMQVLVGGTAVKLDDRSLREAFEHSDDDNQVCLLSASGYKKRNVLRRDHRVLPHSCAT